jgi:thiol-disulfide isomerase/thioredoxin
MRQRELIVCVFSRYLSAFSHCKSVFLCAHLCLPPLAHSLTLSPLLPFPLCRTLAPEYEEAASAFKGLSGAKIAGIDGDAFPSLATRFNVKGFPTLLWFEPGEKIGKEYDGPRTSAGIVKYVNARAHTTANIPGLQPLDGPSAVHQLDSANWEKLVEDEGKDVVVYFYAPWCPHCKRLTPEYEQVARKLSYTPNLLITAVDCDEHPKECEHIDGFPTVMVYSRKEEGEVETDAVVKKKPEELALSPSTTAEQLIKLIEGFLDGSVEGVQSEKQPAAATQGEPAKKDNGPTSTQPAQVVSLTDSDGKGSFFNCDVSHSVEGEKIPEGLELRIEARSAEVQGFPATFSIDAEQFSTYNWLATNVKSGATVTIQFSGAVPEVVKLACHAGKQQTKPDVASVTN